MSDEILSLKLRPRTLDELIGQESVVASVRNQIASGRTPMAWMFAGETGSGKTSIARILAVALNKPAYENFGVLSEADWEWAKDLEIVEFNASQVNGVDGMRELVQQTRFLPIPPSRYRVIILDEAQRLTKQAQDLLLKHFEDATVTMWFICTTEADKISSALQGRCVQYRMKPLGPEDITRLMGYAAWKLGLQSIDPAFVQEVTASGMTSPRNIVMALEKFLSGVPAKDAITASVPDVESRELCRALLNGQWHPIQSFLMKATAEEIRNFRYQALGYLRRVVLGGGHTAQRAADLCIYLGDMSPLEDVVLAAWFTGRLYKVCGPQPAMQAVTNQGYAATQ